MGRNEAGADVLGGSEDRRGPALQDALVRDEQAQRQVCAALGDQAHDLGVEGDDGYLDA